MDSVTQFLLGASISGALLGPRIGAKSLLIGGLVATLPDLDSLIPYDDPIDSMTHHRGFSHSLLVQTALAPLITLAVGKIVPAAREHLKMLLLTIWLVLITHSVLDSLTTYGTQIFWPLNVGPPVAFPAVFIIDPVYSLMLLAGILTFFFARKKPGGGLRFNRIMLTLSSLYLALGIVGNVVITNRASQDPMLRDMRLHVQPTAFNLLIWQVTGVSEDRLVTGLMSLTGECALRHAVTADRHAAPTGLTEVSPSVKRLEWFTDGFYSYGVREGVETITDLRIGFYPNYAFSFKIGEERDQAFNPVPPERIRLSYEERAGEMFSLIADTATGCADTADRDTAWQQGSN